jgi:AraC-like DNA-binding protein
MSLLMAHAIHHGGGQKSALSKRYRGDHPDATPRTASIKAFADRQLAATGLLPTIDEVAKAFAMSPAKVERHFRVLGLL